MPRERQSNLHRPDLATSAPFDTGAFFSAFRETAEYSKLTRHTEKIDFLSLTGDERKRLRQRVRGAVWEWMAYWHLRKDDKTDPDGLCISSPSQTTEEMINLYSEMYPRSVFTEYQKDLTASIAKDGGTIYSPDGIAFCSTEYGKVTGIYEYTTSPNLDYLYKKRDLMDHLLYQIEGILPERYESYKDTTLYFVTPQVSWHVPMPYRSKQFSIEHIQVPIRRQEIFTIADRNILQI